MIHKLFVWNEGAGLDSFIYVGEKTEDELMTDPHVHLWGAGTFDELLAQAKNDIRSRIALNSRQTTESYAWHCAIDVIIFIDGHRGLETLIYDPISCFYSFSDDLPRPPSSTD